MAKKKIYRLSEELRWYIVDQKLQGTRATVIKSKALSKFHRSISFTTILATWERYTRTGSIDYEEPAGRPKIMNEREERRLVRTFLSQPGTSIKSVIKNQNQVPIAKQPVSRRTVRRTLRRRKLVPRVSSKGSEIVKVNQKKRLQFANDHVHWTVDDWSRIVFSDESKLFPKRTVTRVFWSRAQDPRSPPLEESLERKSVNVWGYMRYDGIVELYRFDGNMNQKTYVNRMQEALDNALLPATRRDSQLMLMQDNASYHRAQDVQNWFKRNKKNIFPWPAQSPDLSPMENVWACLKNELWKQRAKIKTAEDTWVLSREIAHSLSLVYIRSLYNSLPERMEKVIMNMGNRIDY